MRSSSDTWHTEQHAGPYLSFEKQEHVLVKLWYVSENSLYKLLEAKKINQLKRWYPGFLHWDISMYWTKWAKQFISKALKRSALRAYSTWSKYLNLPRVKHMISIFCTLSPWCSSQSQLTHIYTSDLLKQLWTSCSIDRILFSMLFLLFKFCNFFGAACCSWISSIAHCISVKLIFSILAS
jgi:hypothetical protein